MEVGDADGVVLGDIVRVVEGCSEGTVVGLDVGMSLGSIVGIVVGSDVGRSQTKISILYIRVNHAKISNSVRPSPVFVLLK